MTDPSLVFYFAPGSSSMAVHVALHEIGAPFEGRPLSFARAEQKGEDFLAVNPEGKVPTLLIDGRPLTEVAAILFYLARRFPAARLLPWDDPEREAQAISWMSFIASTVHPARQRGLEYAQGIHRLTEAKMGGDGWVLGDYSIVDIHLFRLYWRFRNSLAPAPGTFPLLDAHHDRMMARSAVQRTIRAEAAIGYELP